ncbi:MAG TPA: hypothetical protein VGP26_06050 [Actinophytocola sp.]|jgi:hypothetical protein|nr:hypothetical protein [Actinophytocola sp.]
MDTSRRPVGSAVRIGSFWYLLVPLLTLGLLTFLPFLHAAIRLRRPWVWLATVMFALVASGVFYVSGQPEGATPGAIDAVFVVAVLGSMVVGITVLTRLRHEVYNLGELRRPAPSLSTAPTSNGAPAVDPAVQQVLQARMKRDQARDLAATDPLMARELRIGRPDLPSEYDDGGLVDVASAPETVIARVLDLTPEQATGIVAVRDTAVAVDDLFSLTDLPVSTWDRVRDRAIIIR